jgi:hypothetical protein
VDDGRSLEGWRERQAVARRRIRIAAWIWFAIVVAGVAWLIYRKA